MYHIIGILSAWPMAHLRGQTLSRLRIGCPDLFKNCKKSWNVDFIWISKLHYWLYVSVQMRYMIYICGCCLPQASGCNFFPHTRCNALLMPEDVMGEGVPLSVEGNVTKTFLNPSWRFGIRGRILVMNLSISLHKGGSNTRVAGAICPVLWRVTCNKMTFKFNVH